uniref:lytic transglycosylase domain-containing protein n=1 Tax=Nocardia farcinica TaxID=37329 RepID=UPI002457CA84
LPDGWTLDTDEREQRRGALVLKSVDGYIQARIQRVNADGTIPDPAGGLSDGDPVYDRAVGPLQFIPETWQRWAVDANGDGVLDPQSIDDAALTAARYLCASGGDLTSRGGWQQAVLTYNQSTSYLNTVRHRAAAYSVGRRA